MKNVVFFPTETKKKQLRKITHNSFFEYISMYIERSIDPNRTSKKKNPSINK